MRHPYSVRYETIKMNNPANFLHILTAQICDKSNYIGSINYTFCLLTISR